MFQVLLWAFQISIVFGLFVAIVMAITSLGNAGISGLTRVAVPAPRPKSLEQIEEDKFNEFVKQLESK